MKLSYVLPLIAAVAIPSGAHASEARIQLRAYVPTSCSMAFSQDVHRLDEDSFSLGSIDQFCNTNFQLTLYHDAAPAGSQFRFGDRTVNAAGPSTLLVPAGGPVIASKQLIAEGLTHASADALGSSMVLQVTPLAL
jgi:hypothetical protein